MNKTLNDKLVLLRQQLEESLSAPLSEHQMVGFKPAKKYRPEVLLRLKTSYPIGEGAKPKVEFWLSPEGKKAKWVSSFQKLAEKELVAAIEKEGHFPKKSGYSVSPSMQGVVEIGSWNEQRSYSDDSLLAIRGDTPELTQVVVDALQKALPISGGGVPGTGGYKGSGMSGGDTEYVYHYSSFGIGD